MIKGKMSYKIRKRIMHKTVYAILAIVLALGLLGSSMAGIFMGRGGKQPAAETVQLSSAQLEEKLKENPQDAAVLTDLARAYLEEGQAEKAAGAYEKALSLEPQREDLKTALAGSYVSAGQYDKAVKILQEVLSQNPDNKDALYYYGHALVAQKQFGKAADQFEKFVGLAGDTDPRTPNAKEIVKTLKSLENK
ncbi:MAG: tetratricopeptide repeat protein [Bacillota bacterium]